MNLAQRILMARRSSSVTLVSMDQLGAVTVGPSTGQYDPVTDTGYYGLVPSTDLIAGNALASQIGFTAGVSQNNDGGWFKFYVGPEATCNRNNNGYAYVAYVAKMSYRHSVSWWNISGVNAVYGHRHEPIMGMNCQVRLMTGADADPASYTNGTTCLENPGRNSEWNELFYRIHEEVPDCSDPTIGSRNVDRHGGPQNGDNWADYTNTDTQIANNGQLAWCQETDGIDTARRVFRGNRVANYVTGSPATSFPEQRGWRPVLQPTSLDPDSDPYDFSV